MKNFKILIILGGLICSSIFGLIDVQAASNPYKKSSSYGTNCTWYAWQMAHDKGGVSLPGWGNASTWYNYAKNAGFEVGQTPKANSIVVWDFYSNSGKNLGHVGYVEKVVGDKIYVWDSASSCLDWDYPPFKECMDEAMKIDQEAQEMCFTQYAKSIACEKDSSYWHTPGDLIGYIYLDNIPKKQNAQKKSTTKNSTTKKSTTKKITTTNKAKSDNSYLKNLSIDGIKFEFNKEKFEYELSVKNDITSIIINAESEDEKASIQGFGGQDLKVGENTFRVIVTAEDESTLTYTLKVTREEEELTTTTSKVIEEKIKKSRSNDNNLIIVALFTSLIVFTISLVIFITVKCKKVN